MSIKNRIDELVGKTPMLFAHNFGKGLKADLLLKLEYFNPAGSVKDRVALKMLDDAEKSGLIREGATIIEPTSGNTGIGLAAIGGVRGYKVIITMPDTMSAERRNLMKAYGAQLVLTDGKLGMAGAIEKAKEICDATPNSFIPGQFDNPSNPDAHYCTTGPEIWEDTDGAVDIFVAGVGTGGTLSGVAKYLKEKNPKVEIVAVEPADSPYISQGKGGPHGIQGIGAGFIPENLNVDLIDRVMTVTTDQAFEAGRELAKTEGIMVGISSGAALWAARQVAAEPQNEGKRIVVILADSGDRYLSTEMYNQ